MRKIVFLELLTFLALLIPSHLLAQTCTEPSYSKANPGLPKVQIKPRIDKEPFTTIDFEKWSQPLLIIKESGETPAVFDRDYDPPNRRGSPKFIRSAIYRVSIWTATEVYPYVFIPDPFVSSRFDQFTIKLGEQVYPLTPSTVHPGAFILTPELIAALDQWEDTPRVYAGIASDFFVDSISWAIGSGTIESWRKIRLLKPDCG